LQETCHATFLNRRTGRYPDTTMRIGPASVSVYRWREVAIAIADCRGQKHSGAACAGMLETRFGAIRHRPVD
jgi:hypothetical protein